MKNTEKLLTLQTPYETYKVSLQISTYADNDRLAVILIGWEKKNKRWVSFPIDDITVNLPEEQITAENCNFVDTNNLPYIYSFLATNNLAHPTDNCGISGYCIYPEYQFNMDEIKKHVVGKNVY